MKRSNISRYIDEDDPPLKEARSSLGGTYNYSGDDDDDSIQKNYGIELLFIHMVDIWLHNILVFLGPVDVTRLDATTPLSVIKRKTSIDYSGMISFLSLMCCCSAFHKMISNSDLLLYYKCLLILKRNFKLIPQLPHNLQFMFRRDIRGMVPARFTRPINVQPSFMPPSYLKWISTSASLIYIERFYEMLKHLPWKVEEAVDVSNDKIRNLARDLLYIFQTIVKGFNCSMDYLKDIRSLILKHLDYLPFSIVEDNFLVNTLFDFFRLCTGFSEQDLIEWRTVLLVCIEHIGSQIIHLDIWFPSLIVDNDSFMREAISRNPLMLKHAPLALQSDKQLVKVAVTKDFTAYEYIAQTLRDDEEIAVIACTQSGNLLQYCSQRLRGNKSLVLNALTHSGHAFIHASDEMKADHEVALRAITFPPCLSVLPSSLFEQESFIRKAMRIAPNILTHAPASLRLQYSECKKPLTYELVGGGDRVRRRNYDRVMSAIMSRTEDTADLLRYSPELQKNRDIVLESCRTHSHAYNYASQELQDDPDVLTVATLYMENI